MVKSKNMVVTTNNTIVLNIEKDNIKSCIIVFKNEDKDDIKDFLIEYYGNWDVQKEDIKELSWEFVLDQEYGYEYNVYKYLDKDLAENRLYIMETLVDTDDVWFSSGRQPRFK